MEGQSKPYRLECRAFTGVSAGARYLATVVRESSGKTPLEMIHRYTANMIAQHLRSTNLTVKEICTELEFPQRVVLRPFRQETSWLLAPRVPREDASDCG